MPEIDFYGKIDIDHTKVLKNYGAWQQSGQIIKRTQSHRQRTNQLVAVVLCLCSLQCSACVQGSAHYSVLLGSLRDGPMLMHFFIPSLRPFPPLCLLSLLFSWLWFPAILFAFQSRSISVLSAAPFHHKHFIGSALTLTEAERWGGFSCKVSLEVCWSQNQLWKKSPKKKKINPVYSPRGHHSHILTRRQAERVRSRPSIRAQSMHLVFVSANVTMYYS